ncbi:MAG: DNA repair protein RecO [Caulobacteraceae bacterium]
MEFEDEAFVLSARLHGETGAIVELLTREHGKQLAHIAGGASRRMKPILQPGTKVVARYRARLAEQLGSARLEAIGEGPSVLFSDPLALAGLAAACAIAAGALAEREAHPGVFSAFERLMEALANPDLWPAILVRFEAGLLGELGYGFDFSRCAVTGSSDDLVFVSPRTGRAVSRAAAEPYRSRLLPLPAFLVSSQARVAAGDVGAGLELTGYFLARCVFANLSEPLPTSRRALIPRLAAAGRL